MYTNTPSDRMQLRGMGELPHPAQCMVCGSGTKDKGYIDLGVWYEFEGNMLICIEDCLSQAAELGGCLLPDEAQHLKEASEKMAATLKAKTEELEAANERLNAYYKIFEPRATEPYGFGPVHPRDADAINSYLANVNENNEQERDVNSPSFERSEERESHFEKSSSAQPGESSGDSKLNVSDGKPSEVKRTATFDL